MSFCARSIEAIPDAITMVVKMTTSSGWVRVNRRSTARRMTLKSR